MKEGNITNLIPWVLAIILTWFFIENGWPKIFPDQITTTQFENWGYDRNFARVVGILEVSGALLVLFPRLAFYGALLLSGVMIGAIYTHLFTGIGSPAFAIFLLIVALALVGFRWRDAFFIGKKREDALI
jgi:putative oxidoreductase